jgi:hypothetical protein
MKLFAAEQKLQQPSHLMQLQNEMADLKIHHRLAIQQVKISFKLKGDYDV